MDFEYSPRTKELQAQLLRFMDEHIYPAEQRYEDEIEANTKAGKRWTPLQTIEQLKPKARAQGLWNLFLPPTAGGKGSKESGRNFGLSNSDYAPLAEIMGRVPWSSEVFNCSAPDTGNMETIERYGSPALKERWLEPLLDGKIRSCFAMTEPEFGTLFFAGEHTDITGHWGTVHAAIRSGLRVAEQIWRLTDDALTHG